MRSPLRWKLRTLLLVVAVAGLGFAGVALRRRAEGYRARAAEYARWESRFPQIIEIFDVCIARDRDMIRIDKTMMRIAPDRYSGILNKSLALLNQRLMVRSKYFELRDDCRRWEQKYLYAARHPWMRVTEGKPIGPLADTLREEFFRPIDSSGRPL